MTEAFGLAVIAVAALAIAQLWIKARAGYRSVKLRLSLAVYFLPLLTLTLWYYGLPLPWWVPVGAVAFIVFKIWRNWVSPAGMVKRWGERARRKNGVASAFDVLRVASTPAIRRTATIVRPSLRALSWLERLRVETLDFAVELVRVGWLTTWASIEDVILVFGPPRAGKTGWLAGRIVDAPGAVWVTSTKPDLFNLTREPRALVGPVLVFNPGNVGDLETTITFDPLLGCKDPNTAKERAADLLSTTASGDAEGERWQEQARRVLAALLHAAALGNRSMHDVQEWVADPEIAQPTIERFLERRPGNKPYVTDVKQFINTNDRTRTSITATIMPALGWLTTPSALDAASPDRTMTVQEILEQRATVYLLGTKETASAPLVAAFTGYVDREARRIASRMPSNRLDPSLLMALDEAGLLAPPLDSQTSDSGSHNITIIAAFQSRAQVVARWGEVLAGVIMNNSAATIVFGGKDLKDVKYWSELAGERDEVVHNYDEHGRSKGSTTRKAPVIAPAQLTNLPEFRVVLYRRRMPVAIGRAEMLWHRDKTIRARYAAFIAKVTGWIVQPDPHAAPEVTVLDQARREKEHADAA